MSLGGAVGAVAFDQDESDSGRGHRQTQNGVQLQTLLSGPDFAGLAQHAPRRHFTWCGTSLEAPEANRDSVVVFDLRGAYPPWLIPANGRRGIPLRRRFGNEGGGSWDVPKEHAAIRRRV
ncbi:hypothetical protein MSZK_36490 [Mycobacterium sp. shizuoka-1]|nr:hypothetical protein MSZK_36490 [Mycobacterium sp. shizuoka-1]